jgi:hypothetical protein
MTFSKISPSAPKNTKSTKADPVFDRKLVISSFNVIVLPVNRRMTVESRVTSLVTGALFRAYDKEAILAAFDESSGDIEDIDQTYVALLPNKP